jgi:hypothetical protein
MNVIIKGIENLDANDYEKMIIKQKGDDYQVTIKGQTQYMKVITSGKISDELKNATGNDQIKRLVEYFLNYSKINCLMNIGYDGRFTTAKGSRHLELQMGKNSQRDIFEMVIEKYINDRLNFVSSMKSVSYYEFSCSSTHTSYGFKENGHEPSISFNLIGNNGRLHAFEREFLEGFIENVLEHAGERATLGRKRQMDSNGRFSLEDEVYFTCGDIKIKLFKDATIITEVQKMVQSHNKIIESSKAKQFKLEGF